jgi:hypothetical protein
MAIDSQLSNYIIAYDIINKDNPKDTISNARHVIDTYMDTNKQIQSNYI